MYYCVGYYIEDKICVTFWQIGRDAMKCIRNKNTITVVVSEKKEVNLDELNIIAAGKDKNLCKAVYREKGKEHLFEYMVFCNSNKASVNDTIKWIVDGYIQMLNISVDRNLCLYNFLLESDYWSESEGIYSFIYVPITKAYSTKKIGKIIANELNKAVKEDKDRDIDSCNIRKVIGKVAKSNDASAILKYLNEIQSIMMNVEISLTAYSYDNENMEGETTLLSGMPMPDNSEEETTVFVENPYSEYETTVLSPDMDETTILTPNLDNDVVASVVSSTNAYIIRNLTGEKIYVNKNEFLIGKGTGNDYVLDTPSVSRKHAKIIRKQDGYYVIDNGSTNGTTIEGIKIQPNEEVMVYDGALVSFGNENLQIFIGGR